MGASCNLIGKNEQTTIKNYADWSTGWLKTVSYDLILTIQKLKTICNGEHSSESDSVEYNALCELIGSVYKQLKAVLKLLGLVKTKQMKVKRHCKKL